MSTVLDKDLGRVWFSEPKLVLPWGPARPKYYGIVKAVVKRPNWSIDAGSGLAHLNKLQIEHPWPSSKQVIDNLLAPFKGLVDPRLFNTQVVWASVTPNERVDKGGDIQVNRVFGTVGTAPAGVIVSMAVAKTTYTTTTHTDLSIGSGSANVSTNEFTTIGLSRATATVQNYVAASSLNGTYAVDLFKSFTASGGGTAHGAAIFDSNTVSGSFLYCEDMFSSDAVVVSGDTLQVTWTVNN